VPQEEAPAAEPAQEDEYLQQQDDYLSLRRQKEAFLIQAHLDKARQLIQDLDLAAAEREITAALEIDADNLEAKQMLGQVGALRQEPGAPERSVAELLEEQYVLRTQVAEAEARDHLQKAKLARTRGDFDAAIVELTLCLDIVTLSPYRGEWQALESEAQALLEQTRKDRDDAASRRRAGEEQRIRDELRQQELTEQEARRNTLNQLLDQAISAFRAQNYPSAMDLADRVLRIDPRNEKAQDIRDTAFRKERELVRDDFLGKKREQYARWQEELEELRVPYQGVLTLPDEDYWRNVTALRARRPGLDLSQDVSSAELELRERIANTRIPGLEITQEESLTNVMGTLQVITNLPLVVDPAAEDAALSEGVVFNVNWTHSLTVDKALNLLTEMAGPEVTWTVRHDTILITTREKARGELVIYNHDVQDLIFGLTDFLGPRIDRLRLIDDLEDEDGGTPFGAIGEKPTINEPDDLSTLVQENVAVGTWEQEGVSITVEGGNMVVVHTPEVQMKVRQFLEELRRFSASLVTIESKFLSIQEGFLQEVGVDFRGLDNPGNPYTDLDDVNLGQDPTQGLDNSGDGVTLTPPSAGAFYDDGTDGDFKGRTENFFGEQLGDALSTVGGFTLQYTFLNDLQLSAILRLVEKSRNVELINDQILSVHNTQRAYVTVVNQRAYVQDFDVEVAQIQAIADPVINVLTEGIVLDVRPTITNNRRYLLLEIQPTVAQVVALTDFATTLAGQTASVTFQLPELEVQSVFTTALVPDGGSILLGGLSRIRNVERRAEVPWLANVPIVGFFFKEEGYNDERESLMILLRAWISDVKEELTRLDAR
jgi:general secretion pathway protein D